MAELTNLMSTMPTPSGSSGRPTPPPKQLHTDLTTAACLKTVTTFLPPLGTAATSRKGDCGTLAVLGCSPEYSGAGHYAAVSGLRAGVDLCTLYTLDDSVASVVKGYGPEVMVRSLEADITKARAEDKSDGSVEGGGSSVEVSFDHESSIIESVVRSTIFASPRLPDCFVIGPGLGRRPIVKNLVRAVIKCCREKDVFVVVDADAVWATLGELSEGGVLNGYSKAVITPNAGEFGRIVDSLNDGEVVFDYSSYVSSTGPCSSPTSKRSHAVRAVLAAQSKINVGSIILKGSSDIISSSAGFNECTDVGISRPCLKRCGGLGDVLTGVIGAFLCYLSKTNSLADGPRDSTWARELKEEGLWKSPFSSSEVDQLEVGDDISFVSWVACHVVKRASADAFGKKGRAMRAEDVVEEVGAVMDKLFESEIPRYE